MDALIGCIAFVSNLFDMLFMAVPSVFKHWELFFHKKRLLLVYCMQQPSWQKVPKDARLVFMQMNTKRASQQYLIIFRSAVSTNCLCNSTHNIHHRGGARILSPNRLLLIVCSTPMNRLHGLRLLHTILRCVIGFLPCIGKSVTRSSRRAKCFYSRMKCVEHRLVTRFRFSALHHAGDGALSHLNHILQCEL